VTYKGNVSGLGHILRVSIDGGEPVRVVDRPASAPVVSPDGSFISVFFRDVPPTTNLLGVVPYGGGQPRKIRDLPAHNGRFRWTPDGRELAWTGRNEEIGNISIQPLDGGAPRTVTRWSPEAVFFFDWSRDGKWIAFSKGATTSDVVLIASAGR
jgi:Tol biopolymer transport system component